jgi:hypothetical protein
MLRMTAIVAVLALWGIAAPAQEAANSPPPAPKLLSPLDDPGRDHCLEPDPQRGIKLNWLKPERSDRQLATYIEIRRKNPDTGEWRHWVKKYANPPFTLNAFNPLAYGAVFAWRVWAVDQSGEAQPYATPSDWWLFCTLPGGGR